MAQCPVCGQPLPCSGAHAPPHGNTSAGDVAPCQVEPGAICVEVLDSQGAGANGIAVRAAGRASRTDAAGMASFDAVPAGAYEVALTGRLPKRHASHSRLPDKPSIPAAVVAGQTT
jgi:hypothetical protein